jgi:hypothetical protein
MSDTQFAAYEAKCATAARLSAEILPHNKQVLFEALAAAGINIATIAFDGSGDSGQFEEPLGYGADSCEVAIPTGDITVKSVDFDTGTVSVRTTTVGDFIETLACDFLEGTHAGWENDDGAHGEFTFSLTDRTITLDYNERYIESDHYKHEF